MVFSIIFNYFFFKHLNNMNRVWKLYVYFGFFLFFITLSFSAVVSEEKLKNNETSKIIIAEDGDNITLPCYPALPNIVQDNSAIEWTTDNDVPVYSKGRLSPFLFFYTVDKHYAIENSSLILRKITPGNFTFTCHLTPLNLSYTYFLYVKNAKNNKYTTHSMSRQIEYNKEGETVVLPCLIYNETFTSDSENYAWILRNARDQSVETISLGQRILLQNHSAGFEIAENKSLIIKNFWPSNKVYYDCYLSSGSYVNYFVFSPSNKDEYEFPTYTENVAIRQGNDVSLKCPVAHSNYVWIRNDKETLFINSQEVKSSRRNNNFKINPDTRSLIITNFSSPLSGSYKCFSQNSPTYLYKVVEQKWVSQTMVVLPGKNLSLPCPRSQAEDGSNFVWTRNDVEYLFINELPVASNKHDKLKISEDDGRSLIIIDFSYLLKGRYVCQLSSGMNYTYNIITSGEDEPFLKKENLYFLPYSRGIELPCPAINNNANSSSFEWSFTSRIIGTSLLYVNQEKFSNMKALSFYDIKNSSLIITLLTMPALGTYTCRRSTGEQYVYDVAFELHWNNRTISTNGMQNLTLRCHVDDPRDRVLKLVDWIIMLPNFGGEIFAGEFTFVDGKMLKSTSPYSPTLPDNIKLAADRQSLIVSNITDELLGEYTCALMASGTIYRYTLAN